MKKFFTLILSILTCLCFFACTPSSLEKAEEKMKDAGYTVITYSSEEAENLAIAISAVGNWKGAEGIVGGLSATKESGKQMSAVLLDTEINAEELYSSIGGRPAIVDGKWVYWGDEGAIKDFTK